MLVCEAVVEEDELLELELDDVVDELLVVVVVDDVVVVELVVDVTGVVVGSILWYTLTELTSQYACSNVFGFAAT
jgi:hypothetical protein